MYIKTDGIILREVAYQDSDKLLTVLTREYGKLTVRARGVRSSRSRSKAACQLLAYSEFTLLERGGRYVVTEATAKEMFPELRNDLELLSLASYFAQAADVLSPEGEENPPPRQTTIFGFSRRNCSRSQGIQASLSAGWGSRFCGGRHLTMFAI